MKILGIIFLVLLFSCTSNKTETLNNDVNFTEINDIKQFILSLEKYSKVKSYPNIDK